MEPTPCLEEQRLAADALRSANWKRWGTYLSERQWATVREDYSDDGDSWNSFPHEHARSRAYRWGEDGLLGFADRECRACFALALWNGKDPLLKERLFGLTGTQGNHGEDVKEQYFYLEATPTYSYAKALYKYPQAEFPYEALVAENRRRGKHDPEFELVDTGVFDGDRYFDIFAEYAKHSPNDILIRVTVANRSSEEATLHLLPSVWFRNTWSWGQIDEGYETKPWIALGGENSFLLEHETLGRFCLEFGRNPNGQLPDVLFTENETNTRRLWGTEPEGEFVKDAFHDYVIRGDSKAVNPNKTGTKAACHYVLRVPPGASQTVSLRLFADNEAPGDPLGPAFGQIFEERIKESSDFHSGLCCAKLNEAERAILYQGVAGMVWSKQF